MEPGVNSDEETSAAQKAASSAAERPSLATSASNGTLVESRVSKRDPWAAVVGLWAMMTALLVYALTKLPISPGYGREARIADEAFRLLTYMASPVLAAVIAVLLVAAWRFGARSSTSAAPAGRGDASSTGAELLSDGAHLVSAPKVDAAWLAVTAALAVALIVNPGIVGMLRFFDGSLSEELVVRVEGARWFWTVSYPDFGVTTNSELVLPVGRRARIEVTSKDVLHSFWVPGLRVKIDAVPGRTTVISTTPEREGSFEQDPGLRLQCAELCGLAHSTMAIPVRLLLPDQFDQWISSLRGQASGAREVSCPAPSDKVEISAKNVAFDVNCMSFVAGTPTALVFHNDEAVPHNIAVYDSKGGKAIWVGETITGPATVTYKVPPLGKGTYFFQCDLHPVEQMSGVVKVE